MTSGPLRLALVDDYEIVLRGLARMFETYADRIQVVDLEIGRPVQVDVDVALIDTFAQPEADGTDIAALVKNRHTRRVAVFTWTFSQQLIDSAIGQGASGYLAKSLTAEALVESLERVAAGEVVVSDPPPRARGTVGLEWPGRVEGLSEREAEMLALITQGKSNAEIARISYLSPHTVKSYLRDLYRKLDVRNRTEAAVWGLEHGFTLGPRRVDDWY